MTAIPGNSDSNKKWLHFGILAVAIVIAYSKLLHAGFMAWDDNDYIFHTKDISSGIGWEQIKHWFTTFYIGNYQPLSVFTYALDHVLGGSQPFIYHADNLLWHIADTFLIYLLINRLQENKWVGLFVALLFALHPVQTESVSWIAARNKGMNVFFYCSALLSYLSYVKTGAGKKLLWVTVLGGLAYLCKSTAVALPLALFAMDIWLQRPLRDKKLWLEKLPLVLLAIPIAIATIQAQKQVNFLGAHQQGVSIDSFVYAGYAYVQYIVQLLFPLKLSVLYPYPTGVGFIHILYLCIAAGIQALMVVAYRRRWYVLAGGILFYTVNILPVLQFVQFGEVLMADRYLYIACIGIWFPAVYYLFRYFEARSKQIIALTVSCLISLVFLVSTFVRNDIWLSDFNFFTAILDTFPDSAVAEYSVGALYMKMGNYAEAEKHLNTAVLLDPNNYKAWHNKGALHLRQGKAMEALDALNKCLELKDYNKAYFTRAMLYEGTGKPDLAITDIDKVLAEQPQNARAWYIKGDCTDQLGKAEEAMTCYTNAIEFEAVEPLFYIRRGLLSGKTGKCQPAQDDLDKAISLKPGSGEAYYYRAMVKNRCKLSPCNDLKAALARGYKPAQEALDKFCKDERQ